MTEAIINFKKELNKSLQLFQDENGKVSTFVNDALGNGSRFRPTLAFIGFNLFSEEIKMSPPLLKLSLSLELLHKASIVLDDYIDHDDWRRGNSAFHILNGDEITIIFPYYLIAKSNFFLAEAVQHNKDYADYILSLYSEIIDSMASGTIMELSKSQSEVLPEDSLTINTLQSSIFLKNCLLLGYLLSDAPMKQYFSVLQEIGMKIGHIFQTLNDLSSIIDPIGEQIHKGKGFSDLASKRNNIVVSTALEEFMTAGIDSDYQLYIASLENECPTKLLEMIDKTEAVDKVKYFVDCTAKEILFDLTTLPETPATKFMQQCMIGELSLLSFE